MLTQNGVPILAVYLEPLVALFITIVGILIFKKYRERRNKATLYLAIAVLSLALAIWASGGAKIIEFYKTSNFDKDIASFGIVVAYIFTALANVFSMAFIAVIFLNENPHIPIIFAILNGITMGMLIVNLSFSEDAYSNILIYLIWHIFMSLYIYISLAVYSFKESKKSDEKIPQTGFKLIGFYGVFVALVFILFIIDLVLGMVTDSGYTPFYYMAWISAAISSLFAYLGYVMPNWLKNRLSE